MLGVKYMDFEGFDPKKIDEYSQQAKEPQAFFTEHFYTCTPQILGSLAESCAGGGSMTENIDKAGGEGTGVFAKQVIDIYLSRL